MALERVYEKRLRANVFTPSAPNRAFSFTNVNVCTREPYCKAKLLIQNKLTFVNISAPCSAPQFPI